MFPILNSFYSKLTDARHNWPNNYPNYHDLRDYFDTCDRILDIKSQTAFESVVTGAQFNTEEGRWHVETADGRTAKARYLVSNAMGGTLDCYWKIG